MSHFAKRPKKKLKQKVLESVAKETIGVEVPAPAPPTDPNQKTPEQLKDERDLSMFSDWLLGKTFTELSEKYNIDRSTVAVISKRYGWKKLKNELKHRQYKKAMLRMKESAIRIQSLLDEDLTRMVDDVREKKRPLTTDERAHLRSLQDRILKEIRLEDGQPTEIESGGPRQLEIILPPGAKRFGVMPPGPNVKLIESDKKQDAVINIDDFQDEQ